MKFSLLSLLAIATLSITSNAAPNPSTKNAIIPNRYIITLKPDADQSQFTRALRSEVERENGRGGVDNAIDRQLSIADSFKGYTGTFSQGLIEKLKSNPRVASVEPDRIVSIKATQANPPSWGLTRVSQRTRSLPGSYTFPDLAGSGVTVYVIDSGIAANHPDFGGRAAQVWKADPSWNNLDENGHGTHVAGTIAGRTFGVAKQSRVVGLKVFDASGSGPSSGVLAALEWVVQQARANGGTTIVNMSLGGDRSESENRAIEAATRAGLLIVAAAGNETQDACNVSPASAPSALTVAASTSGDRLDWYSNFGRCVDIIAPGGNIVSATPNGGSAADSGTSMAAPHVAGAAALILASNPSLTPAQLTAEIINRSTRNAITGTLRNTPNRLLYVAPQ
ncbi:alkaline serine protease [Catenaria anguillulae PL171]|uniref:Alkaline serine protease n=1 Tax=Catenaria anguillulae PL171 TaxID=765915 RepID=A0A1Y2HQQ9_9FUNG|nr:alkaline serine protease [Catenaria anguillulae PL171]